jgi:hypothetical protein
MERVAASILDGVPGEQLRELVLGTGVGRGEHALILLQRAMVE